MPVSTKVLEEWLPHRPPMVWVDHVTRVTATDGECSVKLRNDALYMGSEGVRPSSMIEWLAQGFGYLRALQHLYGLLPMSALPSRVFLVGIKDAQYPVALHELDLKEGDELGIHVGNIKTLGPITLFDGSIFSRASKIFEAKIRVFSE